MPESLCKFAAKRATERWKGGGTNLTRYAVCLLHRWCRGARGIIRCFFVHSVGALPHRHDPACASGRPQIFLRTVPGLSIPCLLSLVFACKRDDIGRAHCSVAWTAREMVDFAVLIPPHVPTAGS